MGEWCVDARGDSLRQLCSSHVDMSSTWPARNVFPLLGGGGTGRTKSPKSSHSNGARESHRHRRTGRHGAAEAPAERGAHRLISCTHEV